MKSLSSYRFFLFLIIAGFATPSFAYDSGVAGKSYVDSIVTTLDTKIDKTIPSETGNIAVLDATGNIEDGGLSIDFFATALAETVSSVNSETVGGTKTFLEAPLIPTAPLPTK